MEMSYGSIVLSVFAVFITSWVYRFLTWVWFTPKKLEKCLREQGFKGNSYRVFIGDHKESGIIIREALSKPIDISDDIKPRVIPHILKTMKNHGKNSFMWVGTMPRVHITEPELIKDVLTKHQTFQKNHHSLDPLTKYLFTGLGSLEGEKWAKRRKIMNYAFQLEKLKLMMPAFYLSCLDTVNKWEKIISTEGSTEVEVLREFDTITGYAISRTLFGGSFIEGKKAFDLVKELIDLTAQVIKSMNIPGRRFMPTKRNNRIKRIDKDVRVLITELIDNKMKAIKAGDNNNSTDFLGLLLESNLNETDERKKKSDGMIIEELIEDCKLLCFAGHDTTAALLCWTMMMLSRYPEWQARAREEVLQVFGDNKPDHNGMNRLKIITMILYEVLRLYPPLVELTKVTQEDTKLGGFSIPAGVQLLMPTIMLHHDPKYWGDDANEFKPERFSEGVQNATKGQGTFFPFSLGPRMCVGQNFVMFESKMALALILQRFSFEISPSYVHAPYLVITMKPQFGVRMILRKL